MSTANDRLLLQYMSTAIQRKLDYDPSQVFPAVAPDYDPAWKGNPIIEVIAGATDDDGPGEGAQEGGALLERQVITLCVFYRCRLDQYSKSSQLLVEASNGLLDLFAQLRSIFLLTCFPTSATPGPSDYLLYEPLKWLGNSDPQWENDELGIVRRDMRFLARYGSELPTQPTILYTDYT